MKIRRSTLILMLVITLAANARGQTEVSGNITEDTTWTRENSPYIVTGQVCVKNGATLTIEPGVTVKFDKGTGLSIAVNGTLVAIGTSEENRDITFTSNLESPSPGDWYAIDFTRLPFDPLGVSTGIIRYCNIEYALEGISCIGEGSSPEIIGNVISNNKSDGIQCGDQAWPTIKGNIICNNRVGIYSGDCTGGATITQNIIVNNQIGIRFNWSRGGSANYNDIYDNEDHDLENEDYMIVNAEYNWWGEDPPDSTKIYGYVDYEPWLHKSITDTTNAVKRTTWGEIKSRYR